MSGSPAPRGPCLSLLMTGSSSCALVTQNRWFLARPAALLLVLLRWLVSADPALARTPRSVLVRACHAEPLVLGSSVSFAADLLRRLVSAVPALARTPWSILACACHAYPLVLGSSGSFATGLASPAGLR